MMQRPLRIEVWKTGGSIEWHVTTIWSLEAGQAARDAVAPLYPERQVTLWQDCRVIAKRAMPE